LPWRAFHLAAADGTLAAMADDVLARMRAICMAMPGATEKLSHGEPTWLIGTKNVFAMMDTYHHNADHLGFWCPAPPGAQEVMVANAPERFFRPPYVGHRGWLGVRLDVEPVDWEEVAFLVDQAYRQVAPKRMLKQLDALRPAPR
jgi:hypothetical protein